MMKKLTFQQQVWLGGIIFVLTIILSHVLHIGFIHNLGWIIYGLLFIINPLPPENAHGEPQKLRKYARIAGIIAVAIGLLVRYNF